MELSKCNDLLAETVYFECCNVGVPLQNMGYCQFSQSKSVTEVFGTTSTQDQVRKQAWLPGHAESPTRSQPREQR
jgi:hypothetical protein